MARSRQTGRELYPGSSEADELIYANALLPLSKIPGELADTMYRQRMASLPESEFAYKRRKAKKEDFKGYMEAAKEEVDRSYGSTGGVPGTARATRAGATGRGGSPSYSIVTGPSGEPVVSGMEFGPGLDPIGDLTTQMLLPDRAQVAERLEARRAEGERRLAEHRAIELEAGALPTAEERAQQLIRQIAGGEAAGPDYIGPPGLDRLTEKRALSMAERELAGKKTPVLDRLLGLSGWEAERPDLTAPPRETRPADIPEALQRALDAPEDPYREQSGGYISMEEAEAIEESEVMVGVMEGDYDYLGRKAGKRVMKRRAYERYLSVNGEEEAAAAAKAVRIAARDQERREKAEFKAGMDPIIRSVIKNPEERSAFLDMYWAEPDDAKAASGQAFALLGRKVAVSAAHRRLTLRKEAADGVRDAKEKELEVGVQRRFEGSLGNVRDGISKEEGRQTELLEEAEETLRGIAGKWDDDVPWERGYVRLIDSEQRARRAGSTPRLSDEDFAALTAAAGQRRAAESALEELQIDEMQIDMEENDARDGRVRETFSIQVGNKIVTRQHTGRGGSLSFNIAGHNAATMAGNARYVEDGGIVQSQADLAGDMAYLGQQTRATKEDTRATPAEANIKVVAERLGVESGLDKDLAYMRATSLAATNKTKFWNIHDKRERATAATAGLGEGPLDRSGPSRDRGEYYEGEGSKDDPIRVRSRQEVKDDIDQYRGKWIWVDGETEPVPIKGAE